MRNIINFLFIFVYCSAVFSNEYSYTIKPIQKNNEAFLKITLELVIPESGTTELFLPNYWTDADNLHENIKNIKVEKGYAEILNGRRKNVKSIQSRPNESIHVSYELHGDDRHPFKPHISNDYFAFIGLAGFVVPRSEDNEKHFINLHWIFDDNSHENHVINSYSAGDFHQNLKTTIVDFKDSIFLGGKISLEKMKLDSGEFYIAHNLSHLETANIKKIIEFQRKKMGERKIPYYMFSVIEADVESGWKFGATNLNNSTSFFFEKGAYFSDRKEEIRYISHELFHYWIGKRVAPSADYIQSMWFFEGFTDYLANLYALEAEVLTFKEYIEHQNRLWKSHYTSPYSLVPNNVQALRYWKNSELQALPYVKGHLFAQFCDYYIRQNNLEVSNLGEAIVKLIRIKESSDSIEFHENYLIESLSKIFNHDLKDEYIKFFVNGELLVPISDLYDDVAQLDWEIVEVPDYGFDFTQSYIQKRIIGVTKYRKLVSHLNNGYCIKKIEIDPSSDIKKMKIIYFDNNDVLHEETLTPKIKKIRIPQYRT